MKIIKLILAKVVLIILKNWKVVVIIILINDFIIKLKKVEKNHKDLCNIIIIIDNY